MKFEIEFRTVTYFKTTVEADDRASLGSQFEEGDDILFEQAIETDASPAEITSITATDT